jgi:hypothetical protein
MVVAFVLAVLATFAAVGVAAAVDTPGMTYNGVTPGMTYN